MSELKVCQDRVLPQDLMRPQRTINVGGRTRAIIVVKSMWPNGSTLRVRFMGGTAAEQKTARDQADWWMQHANLKFNFNNALDAEIRISFDPADGAWSYIGTDSQGIPRNQATMNLGFLDGGTAGHEFGHAIGLGHEHSNPLGGIQWNEEVVIRDLGGPPNNWSPDEVRHNVLHKYDSDQIRGTEFDRKSIMLYFFPGTWVTSGQGTDANEVLSDLDKGFIASARAYPKTATSNMVELGINATATPASIGQPGEEDLFTFTVNTQGRYVIQTGGETDVVMKLFGPNSQTRLIAEDDDGGVGLNSKIKAHLVPGRYFAQIRHYNQNAGKGSYTIRVTK